MKKQFDEIDFAAAAEALKSTTLSHDMKIDGLRAMQQRNWNWKRMSLFVFRVCNRLDQKTLSILMETTNFSRAYLYDLQQAGRILCKMSDDEINNINCGIDEFLRDRNVLKKIHITDIIKHGYYDIPPYFTAEKHPKMYIYSAKIGDEYIGQGIWFSSCGEIIDKSIDFFTKERVSDDKSELYTYVLIDNIEYEVYKFDYLRKPLIIKK